MRTKLNRWHRTSRFVHNVFAQKVGPKLSIMCLALLFSLPLANVANVNLPVVGSSAGPTAPVAVGDNAVSLPGLRPGDPLDLSGYVQVPYDAALNPSGGQMTIEAWVKRVAYDRNETIVGNGWQTSYWLGFSSAGYLRFIPHGSDSVVDGNTVVMPNKWVHVAVTYDGTTRRYYINGILDKISTSNPGDITPAPASQPLGIGFDADDTFTPNYFGGLIDNLRIWSVVRGVTEIRTGMFQSFGASYPGLLAEWSFDGDATDPAGGHDGSLQGMVSFTNEGAIPHDVRIPQVSTTPSLDGSCSASTEYANATQVTVNGTAVRLMHTDSDMWVCFETPYGLGMDTTSVYLDPDYTRVDPAQAEHIKLTVENDGSTSAYVGTGTGGYTPTISFDGQWGGDYLECCGEFPSQYAEFRISATMLGGWNHVIGLSLDKVVGSPIGIRRQWPALAIYNEPSTWSSSILGGHGITRTFTGEVVYQPRDSSADPVGVAGVTVDLIGSDPGGGEALLDTVESNLDASFSLTGNDDYTEHRLELGSPPKGYLAKKAEAPNPGVVVDARTLDYGTAPTGTYASNVFILGDALPYVVDSLNGPYFLIVAPQHIIDSGATDEFVDFKRRMGFTVELTSVETVDASFNGNNIREKIRALEQARFDTTGGAFHQYLMLIGTDAEIPFARLTFWFNGYTGGDSPVVDLDACLEPEKHKVKIKYSDWYYADLTSDFDSNGNGCLLDGSLVNPSKTPFAPGYGTPDTKPSFQATVAVGRIPFNTASAVRTALKNSMRFEQQSESFKRRALLAMSYYWMKGQYWSPLDDLNGSYSPCPPPKDSGVQGVDKICQDFTEDAAVFAEEMKVDFLNGNGYISTILYESAKAPDASPVVSPQPLTAQNLLDELEATTYGMVNVGGHGGSTGVGRAHWVSANGNGQVDSPTEPLPFYSVNEIAGGTLINNDGLDTLTPDNNHGSIYIAAACSTGYPLNYSFGAKLLEQGHGVGWVGALNTISVIAPVDSEVTEKLLSHNLRLGDALWYTLARQATDPSLGNCCSARWSTAMYGDPTLSYWGNPGGQSTLAAWPMLRYDARGQGFTTLAGPEVPKQSWEYAANAPDTGTLPPSPVVSNNGEVIVAHGSYVDVLRHGELYQRLNLAAAAYGTPALAADGTIYVLDTTGKLYAFPYQQVLFYGYLLKTPIRYRRWASDLGSAPTTSPIVGADGFIAVGGTDRLMTVRPDGKKTDEVSLSSPPIGAPVVSADRSIYVATTGGHASRIDFYCSSGGGSGVCINTNIGSANSTPPLLAYGYVYVGRADGEVVKLTADTMIEVTTFQADGAITAGPIAGPAGQVLVGTANGTLYSLTKDLTLRWQRSIGAAVQSVPAFSADALYVASGDYLHAYNPYSGAPIWSRYLGSGAGGGSTAVGYGRELYVQTGSGQVVALGEGWAHSLIIVDLAPVQTGEGRRDLGIKIEWVHTAPISPTLNSAAALKATTLQTGTIGILLQRSVAGGAWEDVTVLPPETTAYTDTGVLDDTAYLYRLQVLGEDGSDSDFTTALVEVQSLPALPGVPTLITVTTKAADALGLEWSAPVTGVVSAYRVERSLSDSGPFTTALETGSGITATSDTGLISDTVYFYRVVAVNATGVSSPSAVLSGTTRSQSLTAPQNVSATLQADNQVQISWAAGPNGANTVIEYSEGTMADYKALATTDAAGPYGYYPGEPSIYVYRLKFVLGDAESAYTETPLVIITVEQRVYLPLILRNASSSH
ncbi:MAG: C25 family cysteine peptidase [Chloroflexota bacterium]|nr:C25 family cysteine peptidase [Chloroflexota bacterium]